MDRLQSISARNIEDGRLAGLFAKHTQSVLSLVLASRPRCDQRQWNDGYNRSHDDLWPASKAGKKHELKVATKLRATGTGGRKTWQHTATKREGQNVTDPAMRQ